MIKNMRGLSEADKVFVWERWLKTKHKQIQHNRKSDKNDHMDLQRSEDDLRKVMHKLGIEIESIELLSEFPELDALAKPGARTASAPTDKEKKKLCGFEIMLSRRLSRCNITHEDSMESAYINFSTGDAGGYKDGIWRMPDTGVWIHEGWGLRIERDGSRLIVSVPGQGMRTSFEIGTSKTADSSPTTVRNEQE